MTATQLVLETRALPRCLLVCVGWNGDVRSLRAVTPPQHGSTLSSDTVSFQFVAPVNTFSFRYVNEPFVMSQSTEVKVPQPPCCLGPNAWKVGYCQ